MLVMEKQMSVKIFTGVARLVHVKASFFAFRQRHRFVSFDLFDRRGS